jgi:hypothetical protein
LQSGTSVRWEAKADRNTFTFAMGVAQRTDANLKLAEVTAVAAMKLANPILFLSKHGQRMHPHIGQTCGNQ